MNIDREIIKILIKLFSLSMATYCLSFFSNIILTNFYSPESFGVYASIVAIVGILQPLSTLGYDGAIISAKKISDSYRLIRLISAILACTSLLVLAISQNIALSLALLVYSTYVVLQTIANRRSKLLTLSVARFMEILCFFILATALYSHTPTTLLTAYISTYGILCLIIMYKVKLHFKFPTLLECKRTSIKFIDWPKFMLLNNFTNATTSNIHIALIGVFFSIELVGLTSFAQKFAQLPYFLIGTIAAQLLNSKIVKLSSIYDRYALYKRSLLIMCILSIIIFIVGMLFPERIFQLIIPQTWHKSFIIIKILLLWGIGQLIGATLSVFYIHQSKLRLLLYVNAVHFIMTAAIFALSSYLDVTEKTFLILLSTLKFCIYCGMALIPFAFFRVTQKYE